MFPTDYEEEESEESGKDWDELEAEARRGENASQLVAILQTLSVNAADREDAQLDRPEEESSSLSRKRPAPSKKGSTSKKMKRRR